jgi:riboflavin kinase/FMN adenylyltransferase
MRVADTLADLNLEHAAVAVGNFDGVHRGHHRVLTRLQACAANEGQKSAVVTFFPPAKVLFAGVPFLASPKEKARLLAAYGIDTVVMTPFSRTYAAQPAAAFVSALAAWQPSVLLVGEDFRFGQNREGGLDDLQHAAARLEVVRLRSLGGDVVSSSRIRTALADGQVDDATRLLGHPYLLMGTVVEGDRRGRTLGYPTANLNVDAAKALPVGVFAVTVDVGGVTHRGMANVGTRPTVDHATRTVEVHLFDADLDLYGQTLAVAFHHRLRTQVRFDSLDALTAQLREDEAQARAALAAAVYDRFDVAIHETETL